MRDATIYHGHALARLAELESDSVHCCVTSPPYWGLRCYGDPNQIGLESTPEEYVQHLVEIFRAVRRVLRPDGTLWLNLGDSYNSKGHVKGHSGFGTTGLTAGRPQEHFPEKRENTAPGLKHTDKVGVPWRAAFALQADGWWLRQDNIWSKPNPLPESVTGWRWQRCKVKVKPAVTIPNNPEAHGIDTPRKAPGPSGKIGDPANNAQWEPCPGCEKCEPNDGLVLRRGSWRCTTSHEYVFQFAKSLKYFCDGDSLKEQMKSGPSDVKKMLEGKERIGGLTKDHDSELARASRHTNLGQKRSVGDPAAGRNPRSVWTIPTKPYPAAHFATFPVDIPLLCIRAGTADSNCGVCGAPWAPVVDRSPVAGERERNVGGRTDDFSRMPGGEKSWNDTPAPQILGRRPSCDCNATVQPEPSSISATVLDPFAGAGTTGLVALRLGRKFIGIDVNSDYCTLAQERIQGDAPLLNTVRIIR